MSDAADALEKRVWGFWATIGFGLLIMIVSVLIQVLVIVVFAAIKAINDSFFSTAQFVDFLVSRLGLVVAVSTIVYAVAGFGLIWGVIKIRRNVSIVEYLGLRAITKKTMLVLLAISAGFIIASDGISTILGRPVNVGFMVEVYKTSVWPVLLWIAVIIFAPLFEEIFFRGFLFVGLRQSRVGITGAIFLTALVWALMHVQYGAYEIAIIFIMGIMFGIVRLRTGSLWSTILMHAFMNFVATLQLALNMNDLLS